MHFKCRNLLKPDIIATSSLSFGKKNTVAVANGKNATATKNNYIVTDCEKERDSLLVQVELLNGQLQMQKTIIEGKDQVLDWLKGGFNRPH